MLTFYSNVLLVWNIPDLHVLVHYALYVPLEDEPSILALLFTVIHKQIPRVFSSLSEVYWLVMKNACFECQEKNNSNSSKKEALQIILSHKFAYNSYRYFGFF